MTLTVKEQKRLYVLNELESGRITNARAAEMIGVSERHVYRLKKAYRVEGAQALCKWMQEGGQAPEFLSSEDMPLSGIKSLIQPLIHFLEQLAEYIDFTWIQEVQ